MQRTGYDPRPSVEKAIAKLMAMPPREFPVGHIPTGIGFDPIYPTPADEVFREF